MYTEVVLSLLIAFFATAGAIPLCRGFARRGEPVTVTPRPVTVPSVAGIGIVVGLCLSYFYLGYRYEESPDLLVATMIAVLGGSWLDRSVRARRSEAQALPFEVGISVIASGVFVLPRLLDVGSLTYGSLILLAMVLVTPAATSALGRLPHPRNSLPLAISGSQLACLAILAVLSMAGNPGLSDWYGAIERVAIPVVGATGGAIIYLSRMPWRPHAAIAAGSATRLALGVVVAWSAVHLSVGFHADANVTPAAVWAIVWVLVVPFCELGKLAWHELRRRSTGPVKAVAWTTPGSAPVSGGVLVGVVSTSAFGVALFAAGASPHWFALLLVPTVLAYVLTPLLIESRRGTRSVQALEPR